MAKKETWPSRKRKRDEEEKALSLEGDKKAKNDDEKNDSFVAHITLQQEKTEGKKKGLFVARVKFERRKVKKSFSTFEEAEQYCQTQYEDEAFMELSSALNSSNYPERFSEELRHERMMRKLEEMYGLSEGEYAEATVTAPNGEVKKLHLDTHLSDMRIYKRLEEQYRKNQKTKEKKAETKEKGSFLAKVDFYTSLLRTKPTEFSTLKEAEQFCKNEYEDAAVALLEENFNPHSNYPEYFSSLKETTKMMRKLEEIYGLSKGEFAQATIETPTSEKIKVKLDTKQSNKRIYERLKKELDPDSEEQDEEMED